MQEPPLSCGINAPQHAPPPLLHTHTRAGLYGLFGNVGSLQVAKDENVQKFLALLQTLRPGSDTHSESFPGVSTEHTLMEECGCKGEGVGWIKNVGQSRGELNKSLLFEDMKAWFGFFFFFMSKQSCVCVGSDSARCRYHLHLHLVEDVLIST